ncbi:MAG TPA: HPF/RaiA family ribosome-associated protein [Actinomycetota bacterium]|nr:HPF/RaiA family ribosome-associated protein [Actinomycetota bacterium]
MKISVTSPGAEVTQQDVAQIEKDLEKIDRRLKDVGDVSARVRITNGRPQGYDVLLEVEFRRNHLRATSMNGDMGVAVRDAREDILRQINDRSRGGHSSFSKH